MIVTIFRSRLNPDAAGDYPAVAADMSAKAQAMPGYVSHKIFTAEDGERVTIVEFDSPQSHRAWAEHPDHRAAQKQGRDSFYSEYTIQVCEVKSSREFHKTPRT
jgi:heme-degrading monooxygenase HmoA